MQKIRSRRKRVAALTAGAALAPVCSGLASLLGYPLYPASYAWNQSITNAPVAANSATFIAEIGGSVHIHPDWGHDSPTNGTSALYGIPYNVVHGNSTAKINVVIDNYASESDPVPVPIPAGAVIEGDYQNGPNTNGPGYNPNQRGDSHLIVWDEDNNIGYEFYEASRPTEAPYSGNPSNGKWHAAQESVWYFNTNSFRTLGDTSADAGGLSILAGLARPDEGLPASQGGQGAINHALRMTLLPSDISSKYIYPASHMISEPGIIPMGTRLRLKNTTAINNLINTMGPQSQILARAMQQYGLILADAGSSMYVTGTSAAKNATNGISLTWNMDNDVVGGITQLTASDFDVVNLTPIVTGLSATNASPGSPVTIIGQNFSGAAGHESVFFGTNAASSVSVLSDTQILATVPGGSGNVDVTVQSGTNEVDYVSSNPGDNVNAPIFGYGTSALTNADKFTFLPALPTFQHITISGGKIIINGANNSGPGGTYHLFASTNLLLPRPNWTVQASGSFDSNGKFGFTNSIGTNPQQFYYLAEP
jgi:hypothetical protein